MTADIVRYRPDDRVALDTLYRRVLGDDRAEALGQRWEWLYLQNPNLPDGAPLIWLVRDGSEIVGQYATMPVRLSIHGTEIDGAWGTDVMVAPERQRQGLGDRLFGTWDRNVGASIGVSLTDASHALFHKLHWPDMGRIPRFIKPLSRRALNGSHEPNRYVEALARSWGRLTATLRLPGGEIQMVQHFDDSLTRLWERVASRFAFAVRRDAAYLNWKYVQAPHVRYSRAVLLRNGETAGFAVYRHFEEPRWRVTMLVDFLTDPSDPGALATLLRWIDREARAAGSDLIRVFATHTDFHDVLRASGYRLGAPASRFVAKINAVPVPSTFYDSFDRWHVTHGDSDADR